MLKSVTINLTALFFLSLSYSQSNQIYGSFESNAVYYQENEEEDYENKLGSNNYLNINLTDMLGYLLKPYCKNFVFSVDSIWVNKYSKNNYQGSHVHPSDFSFIIYYKTDKSYTVFNSPVKNLTESFNNKFFIKHYEPKLKQGDIIIFPSYLEHWVRPNSNNVTVAGNIKIIKLIKSLPAPEYKVHT